MALNRHGDARRVIVLLDANALMMPAQFGVDIFAELTGLLGSCEPATFPCVRAELAGISRGKGKDAAAARVGIALADRCTTIGDPFPDLPVDEQIARYAEASGCPVLTNDRGLRTILVRLGVPVIVMRKQKKLEILRG
ncbi:MAG: nucleotide-binding protein [Methanomicrobiales archaeon]|nr:nucleotide-binding protein [Methanomicrobiales archaeon]